MVLMEQLGDDELTSILFKISNKNDLKSFSQVSKRFLKVACFRLVRFLNISFVDMLYDILPASPNVKVLSCSKPFSNAHLILLSHSCPKLKCLTLCSKSSDSDTNEFDYDYDFDDDGLCAVANACNRLRIVMLKRRLNVGDVGVTYLLKSLFNILRRLDLDGCVNVSDESLKAIGEATRLKYLGLQGCTLITDLGMEYLANGDLKNCLRVLVLAECDRISDTGIISLKKIVGLKALYLNKCGVNVTDSGVVALLSEIPNIQKMDLSWLINITDISLRFMATKCLELRSIYLNGCKAITGRGVRAFAYHPRLETFELYSCRNISWEDVELVGWTCTCLASLGLSRRIETSMGHEDDDGWDNCGHEDDYGWDNCVTITWK